MRTKGPIEEALIKDMGPYGKAEHAMERIGVILDNLCGGRNPYPHHPHMNSPWDVFPWKVALICGPAPTGDAWDLLQVAGFYSKTDARKYAKGLSQGLHTDAVEVVFYKNRDLWKKGYRNGKPVTYGFSKSLTLTEEEKPS